MLSPPFPPLPAPLPPLPASVLPVDMLPLPPVLPNTLAPPAEQLIHAHASQGARERSPKANELPGNDTRQHLRLGG